MLLATDDASGAVRHRTQVGWATAGGLLIDLVLAGRIRVSERYLSLLDTTPTGDALLDGRMGLIGEWRGERTVGRVTEWLGRDRSKALEAAVGSLCDRGILAAGRRILGVVPVRRYPEADGAPERELRGRPRTVVLDGARPDERTAPLIALIHATKLHALALPDTHNPQVFIGTASVASGQWASDRVRTAIHEVTAAALGVSFAPTITSS
ncbi:GOLPH3/VPS74 family protein [Streptomyces sp. NBC_00239]|uniref:GOLPH3/VPS74 family protein n=1 Tax=Streptomyces sp. NBC_00239 TaxID=2903640 RepID=UPI002E29A7D7|nr:GPP34 family phosphoprotein [Streptomyces sp. NBC_00239]